jgi:5-methylthioadenosine/S-adenosylhomocysteine deaminase
MMQRFHADHLLIGGDDTAITSPGIVDVVDDTITWSGAAQDAPPADTEVHRVRGLLMPAFVNAHAHTPMTLFRGAGEGMPVDEWLAEVMWPREARLTAGDVAAGMLLGAAEQLSTGTATTNEMYFFRESMIEACRESGLRSTISAPLIETEAFSSIHPIDEQIDEVVAASQKYLDDPSIRIGLGPHSAYAISDEVLSHTARIAADHSLPVHIHLAELPNENELLASRGSSATALLDGHGLLRSDTVAAHGIWLDENDLDILAQRGTGIVHCPVSNARHAMGAAPVTEMVDRAIPVGLGTDGPASQSRIDMFEAMRQAIMIQRVRTGDGASMTPSDALLMATSGSADVMGRNDLGRLSPGGKADMVRIDLAAPSMGPILGDDDIVTSVVWAGSREAVTDVWIGGRPIVKDTEITTVNLADAQREVAERATRLASA